MDGVLNGHRLIVFVVVFRKRSYGENDLSSLSPLFGLIFIGNVIALAIYVCRRLCAGHGLPLCVCIWMCPCARRRVQTISVSAEIEVRVLAAPLVL